MMQEFNRCKKFGNYDMYDAKQIINKPSISVELSHVSAISLDNKVSEGTV